MFVALHFYLRFCSLFAINQRKLFFRETKNWWSLIRKCEWAIFKFAFLFWAYDSILDPSLFIGKILFSRHTFDIVLQNFFVRLNDCSPLIMRPPSFSTRRMQIGTIIHSPSFVYKVTLIRTDRVSCYAIIATKSPRRSMICITADWLIAVIQCKDHQRSSSWGDLKSTPPPPPPSPSFYITPRFCKLMERWRLRQSINL